MIQVLILVVQTCAAHYTPQNLPEKLIKGQKKLNNGQVSQQMLSLDQQWLQ